MEGIIVGCDCNQEWLLPWWWEHYTRFNSYPVAFIDFGMSKTAAAWCREKGQYLILPSSSPLKEVAPQIKEQWENRLGSGIWHFRPALFKKPLAFLQSPFPLSCWIDLDCEIRGNLEPLFSSLALGTEIALVREPEYVQEKDRSQNLNFPDEISYNSGVVAFRQRAEILEAWAKTALNDNQAYISDQNALSRAIYLHSPRLVELPNIYNWQICQGANPEAIIIHYIASWKLEILKQLKPALF